MLDTELNVGIFYEHFNSYHIATIDISSKHKAYYFLAAKAIGQTNIKYCNKNPNVSKLKEYYYSKNRDELVIKNDLAWNGKLITQDYLSDNQDTAGWFINNLSLSVEYFIPSIHELHTCYFNKDEFNAKVPANERLDDSLFWSATEYSDNATWCIDFSNGKICTRYKNCKANVRAVTRIVT